LLALRLGAALVDEVDPFIGGAGGGNTFPGAVLPWGMVSVSPHNDLGNPSGYSFGAKTLRGFGHVHLSGVGCPDLGNIVLIPGHQGDDTALGLTMGAESAAPGYYRVELPDAGVTAEMTATLRSGFSRYRFLKNTRAPLVRLELGQAMKPVSTRRFKLLGLRRWKDSPGAAVSAAIKTNVMFIFIWSSPPSHSSPDCAWGGAPLASSSPRERGKSWSRSASLTSAN
jgi:putative alpha-1,2-mannosidase